MWHRLVRHGRHRLKIVDVRELSVNLISSGANAVVNFDGHTVSFIALITDQRRNGRPVFGAAFNSIGRFGQRGILRDRMIPRLLAAEPGALLADSGTELDPAKVLQTIMVGENPVAMVIERRQQQRSSWRPGTSMLGYTMNLPRQPLRGGPACRCTRLQYPFTLRAGTTDLAVISTISKMNSRAIVTRIHSFQNQNRRPVTRRGSAAYSASRGVCGDGALIAVDANGRFDLLPP